MSVKIDPFAEPFEERLLSTFHRKGVIYIIQNRVNGKCYVGQTVQTFAKRYGATGMWWDHTTNKPLLDDLRRYGTMPFVIQILAHSKTQEELNQLEPIYALQYNAYAPNGYNLQRCGVIRTKRRPLSKFGTVELNDPLGNDVVIPDAAILCDQYRLNPTLLRELLEGKITFHKGWTAKGNTDKADPRHGKYVLYDEQGNQHKVVNLKAFCDTHGLNHHLMICMVRGQTYTYGGYALTSSAFEKRKSRFVVVLTRDGQDVEIERIAESKIPDISPYSIYRLANGTQTICKGWTLKSVRRVPTKH